MLYCVQVLLYKFMHAMNEYFVSILLNFCCRLSSQTVTLTYIWYLTSIPIHNVGPMTAIVDRCNRFMYAYMIQAIVSYQLDHVIAVHVHIADWIMLHNDGLLLYIHWLSFMPPVWWNLHGTNQLATPYHVLFADQRSLKHLKGFHPLNSCGMWGY